MKLGRQNVIFKIKEKMNTAINVNGDKIAYREINKRSKSESAIGDAFSNHLAANDG